MDFFEQARAAMVVSQLRPNNITLPALLDAFSAVPRHLFVPESFKKLAYSDALLQITPSSYLIPPVVLARLLQAANITRDNKVLDIKCSTGYSTALLSALAGQVVAVENSTTLLNQAIDLLRDLKIKNVSLKHRDPVTGYLEEAPYDGIIIAGAVTKIPVPLQEQLKEGGNLITILNKDNSPVGHAIKLVKQNGTLIAQTLFETALPILPEFKEDIDFVF